MESADDIEREGFRDSNYDSRTSCGGCGGCLGVWVSDGPNSWGNGRPVRFDVEVPAQVLATCPSDPSGFDGVNDYVITADVLNRYPRHRVDVDVWLRFDVGDWALDVPVLGSGGTVRVAVGQKGARSSIWRIWANKATSDVYVAARNVAGEQKFSFHQSGDWRYAWNSEAARRCPGIAGASRVKDQWRRGDADSAGWTFLMSIWVRHQDVPPAVPDDTNNGQVTWVPRPPEGSAAGIHLALMQPDGGWQEMPMQGFRMLDALRLPNGEVLAVWSSQREVAAQETELLRKGRAQAFARSPELAEVTSRGMRIAQFVTDDLGHRSVWDTALFPDPPDPG